MSSAATVVFVTPIPVARDSRTLKQAASLARRGYRSIVVEGEASGAGAGELPFELVTVGGKEGGGEPAAAIEPAAAGRDTAAMPAAAPAAPSDSPGLVRQTWRVVRRGLLWLRYRPLPALRQRLFPLRWYAGWNLRARRALPLADLYVVHHYFLAPPVMAKSAAPGGPPYIYDAHDSYFELDPSQRDPDWGQRAWEFIERLCVRRAAGFVTVSDGVAGLLEDRHGRRPVVIRNSHDARLDGTTDADLRTQLGLTGDDFLLVFIGNDKGGVAGEESLRAMETLPDRVHLAFVGLGHSRHRDLIRTLDLASRVHLVEPVPPSEVTSFVGSADAAALLYKPVTQDYAYALPNKFFQAIAAGLPTIYPSALREVAAICDRHGFGVPVDTADPASIAEGVRRLTDDPAELRKLRARAEAAREEESWEREEEKLLGLVDSILGGAATTPTMPRERVGEPS